MSNLKFPISLGKDIIRKSKIDGWGHPNSAFEYDGFAKCMFLTGNDYELSSTPLPYMLPIMKQLGLDASKQIIMSSVVRPPKCHEATEGFVEKIRKVLPDVEVKCDTASRIAASKAQAVEEIAALRKGLSWGSFVDVVVWPESHSQVETLISLCSDNDVVVVPKGGGTSVSMSVTFEASKSLKLCVDTSKMNKVLSLDQLNGLVTCECGVVGLPLEEFLKKEGWTMGHEPDSYEFSTVGGWVATKASGLRKNRYGNIEDIVVNLKAVTAIGTFSPKRTVKRVSNGPDLVQMFIGSEGVLGIITEVTLRLCKLPQIKEYASIAFRDLEAGVAFLKDRALMGSVPACFRLLDHTQVSVGEAVKLPPANWWQQSKSYLKDFLLESVLKWSKEELSVCTIMYEGSKEEVKFQKRLTSIASRKFGGLNAGEANGRRGFTVTFMVAYIRDFILECNWIGDSFETSLPWDKALACYHAINERVHSYCGEKGIAGTPFFTARVSQVYPEGVCMYCYCGFDCFEMADPVQEYVELQNALRLVIFQYNGSISHHHGVGKLRKHFLTSSVGEVGVDMLNSLQKSVDPKGLFRNGNLSVLTARAANVVVN